MLSPTQRLVLHLLNRNAGRGGVDTAALAYLLKRRGLRSNNLAVTSTCSALRRRGLVLDLPPRGRWGSRVWFATDAGVRLLYAPVRPPARPSRPRAVASARSRPARPSGSSRP